MPQDTSGWVAVAAALGTTLAPWGLAFIQSYAVDKKITLANLRFERIDVVIGSLLTGVIGLAIAVACAATLYRTGVHIDDAGDVAIALRPLAGSLATVLFGVGLLGASLLAAAIVPLATAYSIAEGFGSPASLDLDTHHFRLFYVAFVVLTVVAASVVSLSPSHQAASPNAISSSAVKVAPPSRAAWKARVARGQSPSSDAARAAASSSSAPRMRSR